MQNRLRETIIDGNVCKTLQTILLLDVFREIKNTVKIESITYKLTQEQTDNGTKSDMSIPRILYWE